MRLGSFSVSNSNLDVEQSALLLSDIGNRVKYQNVNSLSFNLGLFSFCFGCYYLLDLFEIWFRFWFLTSISMLRKVPQPQLPQIYASGQRVSPTLRFKLYGSHFEMGRNCYTHTIFCFNVKQDGRGRDVYLFFILPAVVFLIFHLVISVFSF